MRKGAGVKAVIVAVSGALLCAGPAQAAPDDPTPPPPAPAVPTFVAQPVGIGNALGQSGSQSAGPLGLPDLSAYGSNLLLGQNPGPAAPGATAAPVIPSLSAFDPQYLLSQNLAPATPGNGIVAPGLAPSQDNSGTGRIAFLRRINAMYQAGGLKGALLGQQSPEQFDDQAVAVQPPAG